MYKVLTVVILICLLLTFVLGAMLFSRPGDDHDWRDEQLDRIEVQQAQNWARLRLYAGYFLAGLAIAIIAGAGWALVMWLNKKATTIDPTPSGYPLIVRRLGPPWLNRTLLIFDPNRAVYPVTVATGGPTVQVLQLPASDVDVEQQMRATTQAQAVQAIAAAARDGHRADVPAAFTQLAPPRPNVLPPLLNPGGGGLVDPQLLQAVETDWHEVQEEE
jgi:hypothetical protein